MGKRCCGVFIFGVVLFLNCSFDQPEAPSWDATLNFPVTENNLTMSEIIAEHENVFVYEDGLVGLRAMGDLDTTWVGDNFVVEDIEETFDVKVPNIVIPRLSAGDVKFPPPLFIPDAALYYGQPVVVSPFTFNNVSGDMLDEPTLVSVQVATGKARLVLTNRLPVDVEFSEFKLADPISGDVQLLHNKLVTVKAGMVDSVDLDMAGKTISGISQWYVTGSSNGSNGSPVVVNQDDYFGLGVRLVDFQVESISSKGGNFFVEQKDSVVIGESVCIRDASFKAGQMTFDVRNNLPIDLDFDVVSQNFIHKTTREPLHVRTAVKAKSTASLAINIADYVITYQGPIQAPQSVEFLVSADGGNKNDQVVTLSRNDSIECTFGMRNVVIDEFNGRLDNFEVAIDPIVQKVKLPPNLDKFKGINLTEARLAIDFYSTIEMPIRIDGRLAGRSRDGKNAALTINSSIAAGDMTGEKPTSLVYLSANNNEVLRLVGLPPEQIEFAGTAFVGDGQTEGRMNSQSYLRGSYALETPANLSWNETDFTPDTSYFQVNPEGYQGGKIVPNAIVLKAKDVNTLESFELLYEIENYLPISGQIEFQFKDQRNQGAQSAQVSLSPINVQAAAINIDGRTERAWEEKSGVALAKTDLAIFANYEDTPKLVTLVTKMKLNSSGGKNVKIFETDYIVINSAARLVVGVNK